LLSLKALVLSLALSLVFGISHSLAAETVIVNKAFNGREIKLRADGLIRVNLEALGTAGYAWAIKTST
jgi:predicted secreted protein